MIKNVSQHALKSLSCFAAVTFFSSSQLCIDECFLRDQTMSILYFLSVISKPLFFIIMGYMDDIETLTRKDIIKKIKSIIIIVIFWNFTLSLLKTQYIQQGYIVQNGIILNMAVIYLVYPFIVKGMKNLKITASFFIGMLVTVGLLDMISLLDTREDPLFLSNYTFFWLWGGYYLVGHMLSAKQWRHIAKIPSVFTAAKILVIPIGISMYFYERYLSANTQTIIIGWLILEHLHLLAMSLILFVLFDNMEIKRVWLTKLVQFISPAMVGVYIVHYSVFYVISSLYDFNDATLSLTLMILVFIMSVLISRLLLLNKYTARIISF